MEIRRLERGAHEKVLAGVCVGVADRLRLGLGVVRFGAMALALAGGVGVLLYGMVWLLAPVATEPSRKREAHPLDDLGAVVVILGMLVVARAVGLWWSDEVAAVGLLAAAGVALVAGRSGRIEDVLENRRTPLRIAVGMALIGGGVIAIGVLTDLRTAAGGLLGASLALIGVLVIVAPWLGRLTNDLAAERRARLRSEERAEIAAHLHDGVMQTLALIQRRAADDREVAALARRQERELREWLYSEDRPTTTVEAALRNALDSIEDEYRVRVEFVCVGDAPVDDAAAALVAAASEAVTNAARHAGVETIDVYTEVSVDRIVTYVRDRGVGFDPATVATDRQGLANSIVARMERFGGAARVRTTPGEGTEIELEVGR